MYNNDDKIMMLINQLKSNVNPLLYTNPAFVGAFVSACKNSFGMTGKDTYRVDISDHGKMVRVFDEGCNITCCENLSENRYFNVTTIYLEGNSLNVDFDSGTVYRADDYRNMKIFLNEEVCCILRTFYNHSVYDENGFEMSRSWFSDNYEMTQEYDKVDVKKLVISDLHKPKYSIDLLPRKPLSCNEADAGVLYRTYDSLAIAYERRAYGINSLGEASTIKNKMYEVKFENPHVLNIDSLPLAFWNDESKKFISQKYPGKSIFEIKNDVMNNFKMGIEGAFKTNFPGSYLIMLSIINSNLNN
ncbi:MAG: hypothetical protein J6A52_07590 [Bacilli bacterium]|nr:hypothetical protein [Bacilli bacterium]